jgi:Family of unknown function (DUF5518)
MNDRLQPAFWGGLFIGVLSALPIVSAGNICCCLWVLCGGALAAYLRQQNMSTQIAVSEGAIVGAFAGLIGGVIAAILSIPLQMVTAEWQRRIIERIVASNPDLPLETRDTMERFATSMPLRFVLAMTSIVVDVIFGVLGGLLGVAVFKKNIPPPPPGTVEVLPPEPHV